MPSVRIEDDAFGDLRYETLAQVAGLADADHARGKMARLWRQCTAERIYHLSETEVCAVLGSRGVDALIESRLGEQTDRGIRIRGTRGRIEWLEKLRKNGKKGGRPKKTKTKPSGFQESNPPALVPALVLVPAQEREGVAPAAPPPLPLFGDGQAPQPTKPDPIADLWAEQERLRAEVIPGSRALALTSDRRKRVASLLKAGHTLDDLRSCLAAYADEIRAGGDSQWFNGESNWRPDNVTRTLGRVGARASPRDGQPRRAPQPEPPRTPVNRL